ncbi:MAG TPA: YoaK family protein [Mucilaginibacter sp.]|jgi:uncharacterized membrane protein YoaK (UPF0700 family)
MDENKIARNTTALLCFTAGFCDTLTFVAAGELFSAHVTGNFIVFAFNMVKHTGSDGWRKLLSFPVFVLAAVAGAWIGRRSAVKYRLLHLEALFLLIAGLSSFLLPPQSSETGWPVLIVAMTIVVAMGFQNTFGRLHNKAVWGSTTVMTGNVTQAVLDMVSGVTTRNATETWSSFRKHLTIIVAFLCGCLAAAVMDIGFGLSAVLFPCTMITIWSIYLNRTNTSSS